MKLKELLEITNVRKSDFAKILGISNEAMYNKLNEDLVYERFTPEQVKAIMKKARENKKAYDEFLKNPEI